MEACPSWLKGPVSKTGAVPCTAASSNLAASSVFAIFVKKRSISRIPMKFKILKHGVSHLQRPVLICDSCGCISLITDCRPSEAHCPECGTLDTVLYMDMSEIKKFDCRLARRAHGRSRA